MGAELTNSQKFIAERERILERIAINPDNENQIADNGIEIVDIVNDYPWILDKRIGAGKTVTLSSNLVNDTDGKAVVNKITVNGVERELKNSYIKKNNIPVCYMVERKNAVNGSITMLMSMLDMMTSVADSVQEFSNTLKNSSSNIGKGLGIMGDIGAGLLTDVKNIMRKITANVFTNIKATQRKNNLNDEILFPYRNLYFTLDTRKRFVFPNLSKEAAGFLTTKLQWKEAKIELPGAMGSMIKKFSEYLEAGGKLGQILNNAGSQFNTQPTTDDIGFFNEKPKTFTYPQTGDVLNIEFTLYNTTERNAWKKNYRFLFLFALRNLPFKLDIFTFVPPYLYDIIVPGVKRMPISALSQMQVTPQGTMRVIEMDNFIRGETGNSDNAKIQVAVPEAWQIKLVFQSLIAPSANLLLAPVIGKLNINADFLTDKSTYMAEEKARDEQIIAENLNRAHELCNKVKESERVDVGIKQVAIVEGFGGAIELIYMVNKYLSENNPDKATILILTVFGETIEYKDGRVSEDSHWEAVNILIRKRIC